MKKHWTAAQVLEMGRGFQPACVLLAAAELGAFDALAGGAKTAAELAAAIHGDQRATAMLADALAAIGLLTKHDGRYALTGGVAEMLTEAGGQSVAPMLRHQANCLRSWAQLAKVVLTGQRAERAASIRGPEEDVASFIEAMEVASRDAADALIAQIGPPPFEHLLDVGGGPGTWTVAFLRARPDARATLFDLPDVVPIALRHLTEAGLADRVDLAAGDFEQDDWLPGGCDLAWVSAIVHMNSRAENRALFAKVYAALRPGGRVLLRDVVMEDARTHPPAGALFAINMLVNTPGGGTFTFGELAEDLAAAGFVHSKLLHRDEAMNSVVQASRPA
jgi:SAM-dependent methyltransferase